MAYRPLADEIRPASLDDVVGQKHILGADGLLRRIIESGSIPNLVFYGPSGTGKTTVANLIAAQTQRKLCKLNATTASSGDIKEIYTRSFPYPAIIPGIPVFGAAVPSSITLARL